MSDQSPRPDTFPRPPSTDRSDQPDHDERDPHDQPHHNEHDPHDQPHLDRIERDPHDQPHLDEHDPHDPPDLDRIERDLDAVDAALDRLDDGTYWTDEVTGTPLPDEVLSADPTARRA